jgi:hypothetical protein
VAPPAAAAAAAGSGPAPPGARRSHSRLRMLSLARFDARPPGRSYCSRSKLVPYIHPSASVAGLRASCQPRSPSAAGGPSVQATATPPASVHGGIEPDMNITWNDSRLAW